MPTAARLIAAMMLAAVAWGASAVYATGLPEGTPARWLAPCNAALGALTGWRIIGTLAQRWRGPGRILSHGIAGAAALVFWALVLWSFWRVMAQAVEKRYRHPSEALSAYFDTIAQYALVFWQVPMAGAVVLAGAVGAALLAHLAATHLR